MEQNSAFDSFELQLTEQSKGFLKETGKWAMFLSILGFIGLGFMLLGGIGMFAGSAAIDRGAAMGGNPMPFPSSIFGLVYLIMAILYFFPIFFLYKFSSNIKQAIATSNTVQLTEALKNLKSHYKFVGIITIVAIVGWIVGMIVMVGVVASAASGM